MLDAEAADFFMKVTEQTLEARKEGNEVKCCLVL